MIFPDKLSTDEMVIRIKEWALLGYEISRSGYAIDIGKNTGGKNPMGLPEFMVDASYRRARGKEDWKLMYHRVTLA